MFRELESAGLASEARELRQEIRAQWEHATGWRVEPTLREFPAFEAADIWFQYPVHTPDSTQLLADCQPIDAEAAFGHKDSAAGEKKPDASAIIENVIDELFQDPKVESVPVKIIAEEVAKRCRAGKCATSTVQTGVRNSEKYHYKKGVVYRGED